MKMKFVVDITALCLIVAAFSLCGTSTCACSNRMNRSSVLTKKRFDYGPQYF
jgi:hypothetical protein